MLQRETAQDICKHVLECNGYLNQALWAIKDSVNPGFFDRYKKDVGWVMGSLYVDVLREVFKQYPDLEPDWEER